MLKWEFFQPRNFAVVALFALIGYAIFNHFSKGKQ